MTEFVQFTNKINLRDFILIIPSVSVGNIGQLTVDLLITNYNLKKVATIWHPAIIPSVGSDPFFKESNDVCTACELYASSELKLSVIQIRSSIEPKLASKCFEELKKFVVESEFKRIIILSSSFAHLLQDFNIIYQYVSNEEEMENFEKLHITPLKPLFNGKYVIEGGGFTIKLYEKFSSFIQCVVLIKYVSEGDNRQDAIDMMHKLQYIDKCLSMEGNVLNYPFSWEFGFGNPSPIDIF